MAQVRGLGNPRKTQSKISRRLDFPVKLLVKGHFMEVKHGKGSFRGRAGRTMAGLGQTLAVDVVKYPGGVKQVVRAWKREGRVTPQEIAALKIDPITLKATVNPAKVFKATGRMVGSYPHIQKYLTTELKRKYKENCEAQLAKEGKKQGLKGKALDDFVREQFIMAEQYMALDRANRARMN